MPVRVQTSSHRARVLLLVVARRRQRVTLLQLPRSTLKQQQQQQQLLLRSASRYRPTCAKSVLSSWLSSSSKRLRRVRVPSRPTGSCSRDWQQAPRQTTPVMRQQQTAQCTRLAARQPWATWCGRQDDQQQQQQQQQQPSQQQGTPLVMVAVPPCSSRRHTAQQRWW
jgi:hypothetical protein